MTRQAPAAAAKSLLDGLQDNPIRRGQTVLRLIYAHTLECARSQNANAVYQSDTLKDTRNLAYMQAVTRGSKGTEQPTIFQLERYAADWASLVPQNPAVRAFIAAKFGEDHHFEAKYTQGIAAALSLNAPDVLEAFESQNRKSLSSIYTPKTELHETFKWRASGVAAWLENLPPFWASFALTLCSTLGPSVLALPIVFMSFGPLAGAAMVLGIGLVNTLTLGYLAESQIRGLPSARKRGFNQMITHYLGGTASIVLRSCLFIYCIMVLFVFTGGFLQAISDTLNFGGALWALPLFAFIGWFLSPNRISGSLVSVLIIALINLAILIAFIVATLFAVLSHDAPLITSETAVKNQVSSVGLQIAIGAALYSFAGHISISNGANLVLRRRQSAKGFLRGAVFGLGAISVIYAIWVALISVAMNSGALNPSNSVLASLSDYLGPIGLAASLVFIALSLGVGAGSYAMAAHHVLLDVVSQFKKRVASKQQSDGVKVQGYVISPIQYRLTISVVFAVMLLAVLAFVSGHVDLNQSFGLVGGLMAPVVAGVFPVMIYLSCRARGVASQSVVWKPLSNMAIVSVVLVGFIAVYLLQTNSDEYPIWYRGVSLTMFVVSLLLVYRLWSASVFSAGIAIELEKGLDGWDPSDWRIFQNGRPLTDCELYWKITRNGKLEPIPKGASPVRTLSMIALALKHEFPNVDVSVLDRNANREVDFTVSRPSIDVVEIQFR